MKVGIHPEYVDTTITCACGEVIHTRSTKPDIRVEVCSSATPSTRGSRSSWTRPAVWSASSASTSASRRRRSRPPVPSAPGNGRAAPVSTRSPAAGVRAREALNRDAV